MELAKAVMRDVSIAEGSHMPSKGLRHSPAIHAIRSGVPLNLMQRWLGHASMTTTAIYLDALGEEEREIAARIWANPNFSCLVWTFDRRGFLSLVLRAMSDWRPCRSLHEMKFQLA